MFFRVKTTKYARYLQLVESKRINGKPRQKVILTLGKLDDSGATLNALDSILISGAKFSEKLAVLADHKQADIPDCKRMIDGPDRVFGKLWESTGIKSILRHLLKERHFTFDVERAIYITVLHRLMVSGSDLSACTWRRNQNIPGNQALSLHHFYRAMEWLGDMVDEFNDSDPLSPRYRTQQIEELIFQKNRDLFTGLGMVFFDTTSLYFEGRGGEDLGEYGYSKDRKSDRHQMVVGVVIDTRGDPLCMEMWPGSTADVSTLLPVADRLKDRFGVTSMCIVCDRGMISDENLSLLEESGIDYIIGTRMRQDTEVNEDVLGFPGRYQVVRERLRPSDLSPLKVKNVQLCDVRYVVCLNEEEALAQAQNRTAILESLRTKLKQGGKQLIGNKGYRRYLKKQKGLFEIDEKKVSDEQKYDGKYVLRTTLDIPADQVALRYKDLYRIERVMRQLKSILETRPIYHQKAGNIRGHVFCSFLALKLLKALEFKLNENGLGLSLDRLLSELNEVYTSEVKVGSKCFTIRSQVEPAASEAIRAVGAQFDQKICQINQQDTKF